MDQFRYSAMIVEDDVAIAQLLKIHLQEIGLDVHVFHDAESAFLSLRSANYSLALFDWMLPGVQGVDLLKKVRAVKPSLKIMMVTAKVDPDSIVLAIESGADDYVTKPFDEKVLLARVRNLLRRIEFEKNILNLNQPKKSPEQIDINRLSINFSHYTVVHEDQPVHLTPSEFKLLATLFKAQGKVLTRDQLIGQIQGDEVNVTGRTVDTHVFALRKKLGSWSDHIETIRGVGYRLLISSLDHSDTSGEF